MKASMMLHVCLSSLYNEEEGTFHAQSTKLEEFRTKTTVGGNEWDNMHIVTGRAGDE